MAKKSYYWQDEKGNFALTMTQNKAHQAIIEKYLKDYAKKKDGITVSSRKNGHTFTRLTSRLSIGDDVTEVQDIFYGGPL